MAGGQARRARDEVALVLGVDLALGDPAFQNLRLLCHQALQVVLQEVAGVLGAANHLVGIDSRGEGAFARVPHFGANIVGQGFSGLNITHRQNGAPMSFSLRSETIPGDDAIDGVAMEAPGP